MNILKHNNNSIGAFSASLRLSTICLLLTLLALCLGRNKSYATAWVTSSAGAINTLSNWTNGSTSPSSFTTPGDTWNVTMAMTISAGTWTVGAASSAADTITFSSGGSLTLGGAGTSATITDYGYFNMAGGRLIIGGAGTTLTVNVYGDYQMSAGAVDRGGAGTTFVLNTNGNYTMTADTITSNSAAGGAALLNIRGNYKMSGGIVITSGGASTLIKVYGDYSTSGTAAMTSSISSSTTIYSSVHLALPSSSGIMMIHNTSTGSWSGTNIYIDTACTAQLDSNFSTNTGGTSNGLIVDGTLICPATFTVNGTRIFKLNGLATLKVASTTGINGAIVTSGTTSFATSANYEFNGAAAQVTGTYLPASLVSPSVLTINNSAGVSLSQTTASTGTLSFASGILHTGTSYTMGLPCASSSVTGAGATSYVSGTLVKTISGCTTSNYEVGDVNYAPLALAFGSTGTGGTLAVKVTHGLHPSVSSSGLTTSNMTNDYWKITNSGASGPSTVTPTATYDVSDIIGGSNSAFVTQVYSGSAWLGSYLATTNTTSPYTSSPATAIALSALAGEYIFGNSTCGTAAITGTPSVCVGSTTTLSSATSGGSWSSGSTGIATVSSGGVVTGVAAGTAVISYTAGSCSVTMTVTVSTSPVAGTITGSSTVCVGATTTLADASAGGTWSSSSSSVASISSTGVVTGVATGTTVISYTVTNACGTAIATTTITVNAAPSAGTITGSSSVCAGATMTLTDATTGGTWSSSATGTATISGSGIVTGVATGTVVISYTVTNACGSASATKTITVLAAPSPGTITGSTTMCVGASSTLSDAVAGGAWSSGTMSIATVSTAGVVTGVAAGTAVISYTVTNACGSASATATVTISAGPSPGTITGVNVACIGLTTTLSDTAAGGVWSSSAAGIATVSSTGVVTGVAAGTAVISYTVTDACGSTSATMTVTISATLTVAPITGTDSVCPAHTTTLADATSGGTWSSMTTTIATIGATGIVTGVAPGYDTIVYTVTNSCGTASAKKRVKVRTIAACSAGIENTTTAGGAELRVFPNPNNGSFTIQLSSDYNEEVHIVITNILGERLKDITTVTNKTSEIRLDYPTGIYLLYAADGHGSYTRKIIVNN